MLHARHILFSDPGNSAFGAPQSSHDKAKAQVEQEKAKKILDEIVARSHVKVADNYAVKPPEQSQQLPPGFEPPPPGAAEPEADSAPPPQSKPSPQAKAPQAKPKPQQK